LDLTPHKQVKHAIEAEEAKVASLRAKAQRADGDLQVINARNKGGEVESSGQGS